MKSSAIALIVALCLYLFGHHRGWAERDSEMQAEIAQKNEEAREAEHKLTEQINTTTNALNEANNVINQKQSALDRAISSGRVRLNSSCVQTSSGSTTSSGDNETGSKSNGQTDTSIDEQERQTLAAIAEIIAQGDRNTAQLNACIDAYNQVRETINGQR